MRIAVQGYTFRDFTKDASEVREGLKKVRQIGYEGIQLAGFSYYDPNFIAATAKETGLSVIGTHESAERVISDTKAVIEEHRLMGAKCVGIGGFFEKSLYAVKGFLQDIRPATEQIAAAGMKFAYHNHDFEFIRYGATTVMDYILSATDAKLFGLIPDLYWLQAAGINPDKFVRENAARIDVVHLKDMKMTADGTRAFAEIYEGNMDYDTLRRTCLDIGVEWAVVEQDICEGDPFDCMERSYKNLKKNGWMQR